MLDSTNIVTDAPLEAERIKLAFGKVVTKARTDAGFRQRPFARVVGISNSHLRSIESGGVSPTLVTICKIAATLGTDPSALVAEAYQLAASPSAITPE